MRNNEEMPSNIKERHFELVKFDGSPPGQGEYKEPAEIITGGDGMETDVIYVKDQGPTKKIYTGDGNGYAVLHEELNRGND